MPPGNNPLYIWAQAACAKSPLYACAGVTVTSTRMWINMCTGCEEPVDNLWITWVEWWEYLNIAYDVTLAQNNFTRKNPGLHSLNHAEPT